MSKYPRPRQGIALAIVGILGVGIAARLPVGALSPLADQINNDIPLSASSLGLLSMVAPIGFAAAGLVAPGVARRLGLEGTLLLALIVMTLGHAARALAPNLVILTVLSLVLLLAAGFANVLLPSAVKKFTPGSVGTMTAAFATVMAISSAVPPLLAVPLAGDGLWRWSLGSWAIATVVLVAPWIALAVRESRSRAASIVDVEEFLEEPSPHDFRRLVKSPTVWGIAIPFTLSSISAYVAFGLLPVIMQGVAGVGPKEAGLLLGLFALIGTPLFLLTPIVVARIKTPTPIILVSTTTFSVSIAGLVFAPAAAPALWVALLGISQLIFPMCLALFSLRSRSSDTAANVSGFVQTVGYSVAAIVPMLLGLLFEVTGSWVPSLVIMFMLGLGGLFAIPLLARSGIVDEELTSSS